jgi:hypothetical protein
LALALWNNTTEENVMNAIASNLLSGLVGSLIGGLIAGFAAISSVKRAEYYRHCAAFKRDLRAIEKSLEPQSGHPAFKLHDTILELTQQADDVMAFASRCHRKQIHNAWRALAVDEQAKALNIDATPTEYTSKGIVEARRLINERIAALISTL